MRRPVVWSEDALKDLIGIVRYIATDNPPAARRVAAAIRKAGSLLGAHATGRPGRVAGTYEKVVPRLPYILAYAIRPPHDGGEEITILRTVHTSRDWPEEEWPE